MIRLLPPLAGIIAILRTLGPLPFKITIVIPVGPCQDFLTSCLKPFCDYKDYFDIILISDLNQDISFDLVPIDILSICSFYSNDIISGPGICRNIGLNHVKTEYVVFLDSDDYLSPDLLLAALKRYYGRDIIEFNFSYFGFNQAINQRTEEFNKYYSLNQCNSVALQLLRGNLRDESIFQIYKSSFLLSRSLFFPSGIYEDISFRYHTLSANDVPPSTIKSCIYHKRVHNSNITYANPTIASRRAYLDALQKLRLQLPEAHIDALKYRVIGFTGRLLLDIEDSKDPLYAFNVRQLVDLIIPDWDLSFILDTQYDQLTARSRKIFDYLSGK